MSEVRALGGRRPAVLLTLLLVLAGGCARPGWQDARLRRSPFLDSLVLPAVGPVPYRPRALDGQVVLVNFFATWCFPCLGELPMLAQVHSQYAARGFTVVAVGMDLEGAKVLEPFARMYGFPFPVLVADAAAHQGASAYKRIAALPTSFLIDREGRLVTGYQGLVARDALEDALEDALGPAPQPR